MSVRRSGLEWCSTQQLLVLYERVFGSLEPQSKRRIAERARAHGWDKTWNEPAAA